MLLVRDYPREMQEMVFDVHDRITRCLKFQRLVLRMIRNKPQWAVAACNFVQTGKFNRRSLCGHGTRLLS